MHKIAVLYICTGDYIVFWRKFYDSFQEFFLPKSLKEYFVFTDAEEVYAQEHGNVHKIYQENLGWPGNTLKRFHIFQRIEEDLCKFDYIFFFNANMVCQEVITEEEFLPQKDQKLAVVRHPGWIDDIRLFYTYERNSKSQAYIPYNKGKYYVCGGVNGGRAIPYIKLIKDLRKAIDLDLENGIIARYHDESHLNKYILERDDVRVLEPAYCFPEDYDIPYVPKILLLNKSRYFNINKLKNTRKSLFKVIHSYGMFFLRRVGSTLLKKSANKKSSRSL